MIELITILCKNIWRFVGFPLRIIRSIAMRIRGYKIVFYLKSGQSVTIYVSSYSFTYGKTGGITKYTATPIGGVSAHINIDDVSSVVVYQ